MDVVEFLPAPVDGPCVVGHLSLRHQHIGVLVLFHFLHGDMIHRVRLGRSRCVNHIKLSHVAFPDNGNGSCHLIIIHTTCRLDAHDIVGALVSHDLVRRDVHELDVLRHDDMRSDLLVHEDDVLSEGTVIDI